MNCPTLPISVRSCPGEVYGAVVSHADQQPTGRPCEDCGAVVIYGREPIAPGDEPELDAAGVSVVGSEWCTNLDFPSNHVQRGLRRVGLNDYICTVCGEALRTPMSAVIAHRSMH
jgi:hypothetical protein